MTTPPAVDAQGVIRRLLQRNADLTYQVAVLEEQLAAVTADQSDGAPATS